MTSKDEIENVNKRFYDDVYKSKSSLSHYLHQFFSYDQQSKSRDNYKILTKNTGVPEGLRVLDYGSGHGCLLFKFRKSNSLFGCDISTESVKNLIKTGQYVGRSISAFTPDKADEVIKDNSLDIITSSHVLEHVPDDLAIVKLLNKKLKKGGLMLLNLPVNEVWVDPNHLRSYNEDEIISLVLKNGFKILDTKKSGRINGWMIEMKNESKSPIVKTLLKVLRAALAVLPYFVFSWVENKIFRFRIHTHYIVLSSKQ